MPTKSQHPLRIDLLSIFPQALDSYLDTSILKRAQGKRLLVIKRWDIRDAATGKHRSVDDKPYGGGVGMVMKPEPILKTLRAVGAARRGRPDKMKIILTAANGKLLTQSIAKRLSKCDRLIIICGRYEGVDARVEKFVDEKISIGPYVLTGGELAAGVIIDAVTRLRPGVLGKDESSQEESYDPRRGDPLAHPYLEYPHYTRPETLRWGGRTLRVPKTLLSGDHAAIKQWRERHSPHP